MGIRKSTGFLAVLVVALAVTSIGLLIALLLAKQHVSAAETHPVNGEHKSDGPVGAPTVSKDWDDDEDKSVETVETVTEIWDESGSQKPVDPSGPGKPEHPLNPWETEIRMPKSVIPLHYDIYLFPDLIEGLFSGKLTIHYPNFIDT